MLNRHLLKLLPLVLASLLSACGGGGGGGGESGGGEANTPAYRLSFNPELLVASPVQGSAVPVRVTSTLDRTVAQVVNAAVVDTVGVIEPTVQLTALTETSYEVTLRTSATLGVGLHQGSLQVRLCFDNPATCNSPLPGSPFSLPYRFVVSAPVVVPPATVSPTQLAADTYQDLPPNLRLTATLSGDGQQYTQIVDTTGIFQPNPPKVVSGLTVTSTLFLRDALAAGTYTGNLEMRICRDLACTLQVTGSPLLVPYTITLRASSNLTPLVRAAGVGEWAQHQANAAHTGYVPMTLDASKFNRRWRWSAPNTAAGAPSLQPVVTAGGAVYAVASLGFQSTTLYALSEHDKSTLWTRNFGSIFAANPPSTDAGMLYLATSGHSDTFMWGFDASNGALNFRTAFGSQWEHYLAPTIANGAVYTNGGSYGGLLSFAVSSGTQNWFASLSQYDQWTPAVDARYAYAFMPNGLNVIDAATGQSEFVITDPNNAVQPYSIHGAPMITDSAHVVMVNGQGYSGAVNQLVNFNIATRSVQWSVPGAFTQAPAFANGVVYTVNGAQVEARRQADGSRLWGWFPDEASVDPFALGYGQASRNIIVTNNLLFVSSNTRVYALDLATRQTVWTFDQPGTLALSPSGVLYITTPVTGSQPANLFAFNLN